ncbi:hypothetical protein Tco_1468019 [Tanacetum coccineum]
MADMNIPANDAPAEQAPAIAPPTRTDDQNFPLSKWVPIGKSNCVLDVQKSQRNPIFSIAMVLLKNNTQCLLGLRGILHDSLLSTIQSFGNTMCFLTIYWVVTAVVWMSNVDLHNIILKDALDTTIQPMYNVDMTGQDTCAYSSLVKETPDEPSSAKRLKGGLVGKRRKPKSPFKLVDEPSDEGVPEKEPAYYEEEANLQRDLELSLKDQGE